MLLKFLGLEDPVEAPPVEETVAGLLATDRFFLDGLEPFEPPLGGLFLLLESFLEAMGRRRLSVDRVLADGGFCCSCCALVLM